MRDPDYIHPEAARNFLFALSIFLIMIVMLCWFYCTCKANKDAMNAKRERGREEANEMHRFKGEGANRRVGGLKA